MATNLLTAARAKEITQNHKSLDDLLERVFDTAFKGESSMIIEEEIPDEVKSKLEELGYKVEDRTDNLHPIFIVSWY